MAPTIFQLLVLILAVSFFGAGLGLSLARLHGESMPLRLAAKACDWSGVGVALAVLIWHAASRRSWMPLEDNFEAFIWLALLLALFVMYVQRVHPLGGLDWFTIPIVIALLVFGALLGSQKPETYALNDKWRLIHRITAYSGAAAFAVAAAGGAMYLVANRRLRNRAAVPGPNLGSLERLERLAMAAVRIGFALLTIGLLTGLLLRLTEGHTARLGKYLLGSPKVPLAFCAWVVYAVVLHAPINPSFRGRKAALLSIFGFVLMIATLVAVQFM